jgi:hypothetical protein
MCGIFCRIKPRIHASEYRKSTRRRQCQVLLGAKARRIFLVGSYYFLNNLVTWAFLPLMNVQALCMPIIVVQIDFIVNSKLRGSANDSSHQAAAAK